MKKKHLIHYVLGCFSLLFLSNVETFAQFREDQLRYRRVEEARYEKDYGLRKEFEVRGLNYPPEEVYIRVFKKEGILEVWVKDYGDHFVKLKDYTICASAGKLGPKQHQGDMQVPEGYYYINKFNPQSQYFLSLGVSYPNRVDRASGYGSRALGGNIYIHGECKTAGCVPINNNKIKEVYWLCVLAKNSGQKQIPVHIYPFKFDNSLHYSTEMSKHHNRRSLIDFWDNIRIGYDYFQTNRRIPKVTDGSNGKYQYNN